MSIDLVRLHEELCDYYATRLPNPQDAEDFAQRVFERALAGSKGYDRALLFEIARGLLKNEYRDHEREQAHLNAHLGRFDNQFEDRPFQGAADRARLLDPDGDWGTTQSPEYTIDDALFTADFDSAVRGLDDDPRDAFILGELRGLTSRESEVVLGVSRTTVAARRREATAAIREELV